MIRHIVMFTLKDFEEDRKQQLLIEIKLMLLDLKNQIPELLKMEVGINVSTRPTAYDIVLTSEFSSPKTLDVYRVHPKHQKVLDYLREVIDRTAVVDYEISI